MPQHTASSEPPWALRLLPPFPAVAHRIVALVSQEDVSIREVEKLVKMDPSFSAELLGLANSAMFAVRREVKSLSTAVMMVGLDRVKTMATLVAVNRIVRSSLRLEALRKIWIHSLVTALVAERAAQAAGLFGDSAYTAGLLHNLGTLGLMSTFPGEYAGMLETADDGGFDLLAREQELFDIDHCLAGAYLAHDWDFPEELSDAIAAHHDEPAANERSLANLVRISWRLSDTLGYAAFATDQIWPYEDLVALLPGAAASRFGRSAEEVESEIRERLAGVPI